MANYCEYCGLELNLSDSICPNCGAPVEHVREAAVEKPDVPQTIAELKAFCRSHGMPLEKMRFFIGQDYRGPRAFGIFEDRSGNYVVYKNKSDGSRAIRYRGHDEAYAVGEIYRKLQDEVSLRRNKDQAASGYPSRSVGSYPSSGGSSYRAPSRSVSRAPARKRGCLSRPVVIIAVLVVVVACIYAHFDKTPSKGYYHYNDNYYYYLKDNWYYYSGALQRWVHADDVDQELIDNNDEYYSSLYFNDDYDVQDFSETVFYEIWNSSDSSSSSGYSSRDDDSTWSRDDSSWDYDYDSWDSNDTDWDSDW